jgi:MFS family permease
MTRAVKCQDGWMRRLLLIGSAVVFLDVVFYTAITPLLPTYVDELGLSKTGAGILAGSYAAGTLVASLPAGFFAARFGSRRALIGGLLLLGVSSAAFGIGDAAWVLVLARFVQGAGGALAWAGALTWVILAAPEGSRGRVIGDVLGIAIVGALFGPAVGALAEAVGDEVVFSSVLAITVALSAAALRMHEPSPGERQRLDEVAGAMSSAPVRWATVYVAAPSAMFGVVAVLGPLRIDELGGGAGLVALSFSLGALVEATLSPFAGRLSDRVGRLRPFLLGMIVCAASVALVPAAGSLGAIVAILAVVSVGAGLCFAPALALLSDTAESAGLHQGFATGLINIAWALGQMTGSAGGGVGASVGGDALPCLAAAAMLLATGVAASRQMPRLAPALSSDRMV